MNTFLKYSVLGLVLPILLIISSCSNKHLVSINITPANPSVSLIGQTVQFQAVGATNHPGSEMLTTTVAWSSSTPSVATIDKNGLATAMGCGQTTISAQDGS